MKNALIIEGKEIELTPEQIQQLKKIVCDKGPKLTWEEIARGYKISFYPTNSGEINNYPNDSGILNGSAYPTPELAHKAQCQAKLMSCADYLNKGHVFDWNDSFQEKWYFRMSSGIYFGVSYNIKSSDVYFKSIEAAQEALDILGEEVIKGAIN